MSRDPEGRPSLIQVATETRAPVMKGQSLTLVGLLATGHGFRMHRYGVRVRPKGLHRVCNAVVKAPKAQQAGDKSTAGETCAKGEAGSQEGPGAVRRASKPPPPRSRTLNQKGNDLGDPIYH